MNRNKSYVLWSKQIKRNCIEEILALTVCGEFEIKIAKVATEKTLKQLGALFGLWIKEEAERIGESESVIHEQWKDKYLLRIYAIEPQTQIQEMWGEHLILLADQTSASKLDSHRKRISLSWATLAQMNEYMKAIEQHYQAEGMPLSIPDKHYKMWAKK